MHGSTPSVSDGTVHQAAKASKKVAAKKSRGRRGGARDERGLDSNSAVSHVFLNMASSLFHLSPGRLSPSLPARQQRPERSKSQRLQCIPNAKHARLFRVQNSFPPTCSVRTMTGPKSACRRGSCP